MERTRLGSRWSVFSFDGTNSPFPELTCVAVLEAPEHVFVLDTHCGPRSMEPVLAHAGRVRGSRPLVAFNSHADWDHVWGNSALDGAEIVAHEACRAAMADDDLWYRSLAAWGAARHGHVERRLPTLTFSERMAFPDDGVTFVHGPGHSDDSAACWDEVDGVLFVGDNLERPLPWLQSHRIDRYLATLAGYRALGAAVVLSSHSGVVDGALLASTVDYLERLRDGAPCTFTEPGAAAVHAANLRAVVASRCAEVVRERLGARFRWGEYLAVVDGASAAASPEELERVLLAWCPGV